MPPTSPLHASVTIRHCDTIPEYERCVELQKAVWNFDPQDVVSHHVLALTTEIGGQLLGAFDGDRMIGFVFAFPAVRDNEIHLHSHMAAVLPEYREHGIGRLLKLAQRDDALSRGINLIEWTFDPLQARNAHFNIVRLGATMRRYLPDFYGSSSSPLHAALPTDRLVAEWYLSSPRVQALAQGSNGETPGNDFRTISIPRDLNALRQSNSAEAVKIQARVRGEFRNLLRDGYTVTGFALAGNEGIYLLEVPR